MRIAFFVDAFPVVSETFILNQITGLMDRGHTVDIFARHRRRGDTVHDDISRYRLLDRTHDLGGSGSRPQRWLTGLRLLLAMRWLTPNGLSCWRSLFAIAATHLLLTRSAFRRLRRKSVPKAPTMSSIVNTARWAARSFI